MDLPGKAQQASRYRVLRGQRRRCLRSVHREREAMRSSPESQNRSSLCGSLVGVVDSSPWRRRCRSLAMREAEIQPGSKNMAHAHGGTRKPGRPRRFHRDTRDGHPAEQVQALRWGHHAASEPCQPVIPRNEGNEVKRDERRGVGAPHSTDEAGEPRPEGPRGGKGIRAGRENRWRER
jgi:hypothetical protein